MTAGAEVRERVRENGEVGAILGAQSGASAQWCGLSGRWGSAGQSEQLARKLAAAVREAGGPGV